MAIIITNTQGQPVLAKDVSSSKRTRNQIDSAIAAAKRNRPCPALTYLSMADHTQQFITVTIR
jgi:hypothetical protein